MTLDKQYPQDMDCKNLFYKGLVDKDWVPIHSNSG